LSAVPGGFINDMSFPGFPGLLSNASCTWII